MSLTRRRRRINTSLKKVIIIQLTQLISINQKVKENELNKKKKKKKKKKKYQFKKGDNYPVNPIDFNKSKSQRKWA